jgi:hypothetical protein
MLVERTGTVHGPPRRFPTPARQRCSIESRNVTMSDLIFIAVIIIFFVVSALYTRLCEKM